MIIARIKHWLLLGMYLQQVLHDVREVFIMKGQKFTTRQLVLMAMLVAVHIVLSRFLSISAWNIKIGFAFIPVILAAVYMGPLQAAVVGALGDFTGAVLFPIGAYFAGFTATAFLTGLLYGAFLHKKQNSVLILGAVVSTEIIGSLLLNTLWISVLYGTPFFPLMATRVFQVAIMGALEFLVIRAMTGVFLKMPGMQC